MTYVTVEACIDMYLKLESVVPFFRIKKSFDIDWYVLKTIEHGFSVRVL